MPETTTSRRLFTATDKELFDFLMGSRQQITETAMLASAKERGIFYSHNDTRETLANNLSLLPYDYDSLDNILGRREATARTEKLTSIRLNTKITIEDIKAACADYQTANSADEKVTITPHGPDRCTTKVKYTELDYTKTRFLQRRDKEANIEFHIDDDRTTVRIPAIPKAHDILEKIKETLEAKAKQPIPTEAIEIAHLKTPNARTTFFTTLISTMSGYKMETVTAVNIAQIHQDPDDTSTQTADEKKKQAQSTMLAVVEKVAIQGQGLLASTEYQDLQKKGFYITSIIWRAKLLVPPYDIVELFAGFTQPNKGKGFAYSVRGVSRLHGGEYTTTLRPLSANERAPYHTLIEQTARHILQTLIDEPATGIP